MKRSAIAAMILGLLTGCATPPPPAPPQPASAPAPAAPLAAPIPAAIPTTPPELGPAPSLTLPTPVRRTLANGLEVVYVRHGTLPMVHATLLTRGGTSTDPANLPGVASFTADLLDEGAAGMNALELASALDLIGAQLGTGAGWDAASGPAVIACEASSIPAAPATTRT